MLCIILFNFTVYSCASAKTVKGHDTLGGSYRAIVPAIFTGKAFERVMVLSIKLLEMVRQFTAGKDCW